MTTPAEIRRKLLNAGYSPIPVEGKIPVLKQWEKKIETNDEEIKFWGTVYDRAGNTGVLTRCTPTLDVDILDTDAAEAVEALARERFEELGYILVRIGQAPKRCVPFRTNEPFKKIAVSLIAPNGSEGQKIELLCDGQQVVVDGIHEKTGKPYCWHGGEPGEIKHADLPYIHAEQARQLVEDAAELLCREHGYRRKADRPKASGDKDGASPAERAADWAYLTENILSGAELHDSLLALAGKLVASGMGERAAINYLRGLMDKSKAPHDDRWHKRYDDIERLVESAQKPATTAETNGGAPGLGEWDAGDDVDPPPPRAWLLGNSFCKGFVSSVLAEGSGGKSSLRILQALSVATGRKDLTGEHVFQRVLVLLVSFEDDDVELRRRVLAARLHHNISRADVAGWLYLAAPRAEMGKLMTFDPRKGLVVGELAARIETAILHRKAGLVVLDPLVKSHAISENDNAAMDSLVQLVSDIAVKHAVAIDVPHHVSKGSADPGNVNRSRGASSTSNAMRLVYTLSIMSPDEAQRFSISEQDRRDYVRYDRAKLNIARSGGPAKWFKLVSIRLGNPSAVYPAGDEVQTVEGWEPPSAWAGLDQDLINRILTVIESGLSDGTYYTTAPKATTRAAWQVVRSQAPHKSEGQAREVIQTWVRNGLLVEFDYDNQVTRKPAKGLRVDSTKRPT